MPASTNAKGTASSSSSSKIAAAQLLASHQLSFWTTGLKLTKGQKVQGSIDNVVTILSHHPDWHGVIAYNERTGQVTFLKTPPFIDCPPNVLLAPRELKDTDEVFLAQWLQHVYEIALPLSTIHSVVNAVAAKASFDEVRNYLLAQAWDGTPRLDGWLIRFLGVPDEADLYAREVGAKWMIGAVARTLEPGCKMETVLVLEGPQGIGKSTALSTIANPVSLAKNGSDFFGDDIPCVESKDAQQYLSSLWIVELAEMDAARKAEADKMKAFISTKADRYRPPYGRRTIVHKRRCVFAGTVNLEEYLKDPTGGRRFWPVRCGKVDTAGLATACDQLWAEAVHRYKAGEPWHLSAEMEKVAAAHQAERLDIDPWTDLVRDAMAKQTASLGGCWTTNDILLQSVEGMKPDRISKREKNRIGAIMRHLGWEYVKTSSGSRGWAPPDCYRPT